MSKILAFFESFSKPEPQGEFIDLTYGKLRISRTVNLRESEFNFNETSAAIHRSVYKSLGLTPKV